MPAKKIRSAPAAALLSDTTLTETLLFSLHVEADQDAMSGGLLRTLARKRDTLDPAPTRDCAPAKAAKPDPANRSKAGKGTRKTNIGPRSGHQ